VLGIPQAVQKYLPQHTLLLPILSNTLFEQNNIDCPLCKNKLDEIHLLLNCSYLNDRRCFILPHNTRTHATDFLIRFFNNTNNLFKIAKFTKYISDYLVRIKQ
jgi:hypothetical protein